jgi:hypothetical protein
MRPTANESTTTCPRLLIGPLTAAIACAALLAGCSTSASRSARHVGTAVSTTASTSTKTTPTTTTPTSLVTDRVKRGAPRPYDAVDRREPLASSLLLVVAFLYRPLDIGR